jgi:phosphatidylglycerophosphate synthase
VFDERLRPTKQRILGPLVGRLGAVEPSWMTALGLGLGLGSAVAAALGAWPAALVLFVVSRIADGIDGELARADASSTDAGGYADIVADTAVFAAIPLGAAIGSDLDHIWPITAALLGSFYLNTITWSYLAALYEKRSARTTGAGRSASAGTSVVMPPGLIEGSESIVFFAVMLALPRWLDWTMITMSSLVVVGALMRFGNGHRQLAEVPGAAVRVDA